MNKLELGRLIDSGVKNFFRNIWISIAATSMVAITLFIISTSNSNKPSTATQQKTTETKEEETEESVGYIRIPNNYSAYVNKDFGFSFAFPTNFGVLEQKTTISPMVFLAQSPLQVKQLYGSSALDGSVEAYVYKKADFSIIARVPSTKVVPVKTGNDTTWKIASIATGTTDAKVGDAYTVKTYRSQTNVNIFDFTYGSNAYIIGRLAFETKDHYVTIKLPAITTPGALTPNAADLEDYRDMFGEVVKTIRVL